MKRRFKRNKNYCEFQKQKREAIMYGLALVVLGIISALVTGGDITVALLLVPVGVYLVALASSKTFCDVYGQEQNLIDYAEETEL